MDWTQRERWSLDSEGVSMAVEDGPPAVGDPSAAPAAGTTAGGRPSDVTRGAKLQVGGISTRVDWLRMVGPGSGYQAVKERFSEWWGSPELRRGFWFYDHQDFYENGAKVLYGGGPGQGGTFAIELSGSVLAGISLDHDAWDLFRWLVGLGMRATRVDVAIDYQGQAGPGGELVPVGLVDSVRESCERLELCKCRRWEARRPMRGGQVIGNSVYLGRRGQLGSGRMVRIYDKGLEQECAPLGMWERWEVEFSGDCAEKALQCLIEVPDGGWGQVARQLAMGAVDFRDATGSRSLERRDRVAWFADLVEATLNGPVGPVTLKATREPASLRKWVAWMKRVVLPTAKAMMARADMGPSDWWAWVVREAGDVPQDLVERKRIVVWEMLQELERREKKYPLVVGDLLSEVSDGN